MTSLPTKPGMNLAEDERHIQGSRWARVPAIRWFLRVSRLLHGVTRVLAAVAIAWLAVIVFVAVIFRYVFNAPLTWADEMAVSLFVWVSFLGAAVAMREDRHSGVDNLISKLSGSPLRVIQVLTLVGVAAFLLIWTAKGVETLPILAIQKTPSLQISVSWVYAGLPVGSVLMLIQLIARTIGIDADQVQVSKTLGGMD